MSEIRGPWATLVILVLLMISSAPGLANSQTDMFTAGRVDLVLEKRVADKDIPAGAEFQNPRGLAVDAKGYVYVADADANDIKVFDPDAKFVRALGRKGQGPGEFQGPDLIDTSDEKLFVWDSLNHRISLLRLDGTFIKSVPFSPGVFGILIRMRALPDGRLVLFIERGLPQDYSGPVAQTQDFAVELYSADLTLVRTIYEKKIRASRLAMSPEYKVRVRVPFPYNPHVWGDVNSSGVLAIGYTDKYEIGLYDPDRGPLGAFSHPFKPVKLEERDKKAHFDRFRMTVFKDGVRTVLPKPPDVILQNTEFPEFLPPYQDLFFDAAGRLWTQVFVASRASNVFDVFSPKGEFIRQITLEGAPIDGTFASSLGKRFIEGGLWRIERDEEGYASLVKYRLVAGEG
jgi:hypothetical protein